MSLNLWLFHSLLYSGNYHKSHSTTFTQWDGLFCTEISILVDVRFLKINGYICNFIYNKKNHELVFWKCLIDNLQISIIICKKLTPSVFGWINVKLPFDRKKYGMYIEKCHQAYFYWIFIFLYYAAFYNVHHSISSVTAPFMFRIHCQFLPF